MPRSRKRWPAGRAARLWRGEAGEAAASFDRRIDRRRAATSRFPRGANTASFSASSPSCAPVRPAYGRHPRLAILGPLEARLQHFDLIVLGGLNEGTWPSEAATDPFLSRPMREDLGLEAPERRIGLAAHDFASLAAAPERAADAREEAGRRAHRAVALASAHQAIGRGAGAREALERGTTILAWARALDAAPAAERVHAGRRHAAAARPRELSVTEIETWLRDPYAIYASTSASAGRSTRWKTSRVRSSAASPCTGAGDNS